VDQAYASQSDAFLYEMSRDQTSVAIGDEAVYADNLSACADTQQCADLCGGADQVSQCDCDQNNKVEVICSGTAQPQASKSAGSVLAPAAVSLLAAAAAAIMC
jgi:hypothetical protein